MLDLPTHTQRHRDTHAQIHSRRAASSSPAQLVVPVCSVCALCVLCVWFACCVPKCDMLRHLICARCCCCGSSCCVVVAATVAATVVAVARPDNPDRDNSWATLRWAAACTCTVSCPLLLLLLLPTLLLLLPLQLLLLLLRPPAMLLPPIHLYCCAHVSSPTALADYHSHRHCC